MHQSQITRLVATVAVAAGASLVVKKAFGEKTSIVSAAVIAVAHELFDAPLAHALNRAITAQ